MQNRDAKILYKMEDHSLLMAITALVGGLGIKQIWDIIKKKMDINANKDARTDDFQIQVIEQLKEKIGDLEKKIDSLITENTQLREKLARMEERLLINAKKKVNRRNNATK
jgi:predicted RNase H-like nuclease (RuvC/YqgF family)